MPPRTAAWRTCASQGRVGGRRWALCGVAVLRWFPPAPHRTVREVFPHTALGETSEKSDWRLTEAKPVGPDGVLVLIYERGQVVQRPE